MNIGDFLHSKRWKLMQNYIYSWGASVVLIGALFKLEHLPGASVFLGVGLSIEAIIFFISAFEPLMELPDWKLVYPQLRTGEEDDRSLEKIASSDKLYPNFFGSGSGGSVSGGSGVAGGSISIKDLSDAQIKSLNDSFEKLAVAAKGIQTITTATVATESFVKNLNDASQSISSVVNANHKVAEVMDKSVKEISESYKSAADSMKASGEKVSKNIETTSADFSKQVKNSADQLNSSYQEMTTSIVNGFKGLEKSSGSYVENIGKLNKNLSAINTAYEIHLKGATQVEQMVKEYSKGVGEIGKLLNTSVEETKKFNQSTKEINENIQALNNIYGKMLGALNGKK